MTEQELAGRIHAALAGDSSDDEADLLAEIADDLEAGRLVYAKQEGD